MPSRDRKIQIEYSARPWRPARGLLAVALILSCLIAVTPGSAAAHQTQASGSAGVEGLSETKLRAWETQVLGSAHAAEHARQRAATRAFEKALKSPRFRARYKRQLRLQRTKARKAATGPAAAIGRWDPGEFALPVFGINAAMLPTGKVLFYAYPNHPDAPAGAKDEAWAYLWDPAKGTGDSAFTAVFPPTDPRTGKPVNIWCSGTSFLADGRVLVTGGNLGYWSTQSQFSGLNQVYTFNPFNETWTRQPNMAHGRWYPSQMLMPDGRTMIVQGSDESGTGAKNTDIEVFIPSPDLNGVGTITKVGTLSGSFIGDYYPHMFWMPSGKGMIAGPFRNDSFNLSPSLNSVSLSEAPDLQRRRVWGNAVLEPGTSAILELGGSDTNADYENAPATATSERFDETSPGAGWQSAPSQNVARSHANTVLLPDGSMVTVGGGRGNVAPNRLWTVTSDHRQVELWNPTTKAWTLGPSQIEGRAYHSTAILLPDGRVVSAGDDDPARTRQTDIAEIYEPPYLHKGSRPTLAQAPTGVDWNTDFTVATPDANVTRAIMMAPGAATHAVDMNQRAIPLSLTGSGAGTKTFRTPANANVALPGYYMLFILNDQGIPSVAKWVQLRPGATANPVSSPRDLTVPPTEPDQSPAPVAVPVPVPKAKSTISSKLPWVRVAIVRRSGTRMIRVVIGKSTASRAKVRLQLRDRRGRIVRTGTRTLRTGRTTTVGKPVLPRAARAAGARVVALGRS